MPNKRGGERNPGGTSVHAGGARVRTRAEQRSGRGSITRGSPDGAHVAGRAQQTGVNVRAGKAGRPQDMSCDEFLARHSEYMDGLLPPMVLARLGAHASVCGSCARYDRIIRKGIELARDLPDVQPSEDFELRLQHRIFHMEDARAFQPRTGAATALAVAAAIALLAWSPVMFVQSKVPQSERGAAADASPAAEPAAFEAFGAVPLLGQNTWYPVAAPPVPAHQPSSTILASFPGPYSPLVVTPPAHRTVRTVSTEYLSID